MFTSAGRHYLDAFLAGIPFAGRVLDIGGKKEKKRGLFQPPMDRVECWHYANREAATAPDFLCDAAQIPVEANSYDWIVLTEVLEHIEQPEAVLSECARVLKPGGHLIASMPFLFPVHADPYDFQRCTPVKIRREFTNAGFTVEGLSPRGGLVAVILDLINFYYDGPKLSVWMKLFRVTFVRVAPAVLFFDRFCGRKDELTTGYLIKAVKVKGGL